MPSSNFDDGRDYGFADQAVALRKRAGLTQRELGALLGVSEKAIGAWEAGLTYPGAERLQPLIALYLARAAFGAGREQEEAAALWESVRARAPRRTPAFDAHWFAALQGGERRAIAPLDPPSPPPTVDAQPRRHDWGEVPAAPVMRGRTAELATLAAWVRSEGCRVAQVLGPGGIGKTTLAAQAARDLAPAFAAVSWRSLRNAPPPEEWLAGAIATLSGGQGVVPERLEARLALLLELLRERRALLVLDNLEAVLEPGAPTVRYRAGYAGYGEALARLAESAHAGCLLLTSREQPLGADEGAVRALHLGGLGVEEGRALLSSRHLSGDEAAWLGLVERYGGNPLALRAVGETITMVFGGEIAAFLVQETAVFGGIRQLLDAQVGRLSALERAILTVLAVEREPLGFAEIVAALGPGMDRAEAVEAVEALRRRSLLEWGAGGAFTVQPVVLEYVTVRLIEAVADELAAGEPGLLGRVPLVKATAKDYVRRSQERLIAQPLIERLRGHMGSGAAVEARLLALLEGWRGRPTDEQGYGPGNAVNLLRLLRGDLRGLDLSRLIIRHAYLQGVEAQDASLAGAHLSEAALDEVFTYPSSVALTADGTFLVMGTSSGEVTVRRVADRALLIAVRGHTGPILGVALSRDGHLLASSGYDGIVKLWQASSGALLASLQGHSGMVRGVALTADGRLLASGGQDGTVKVWDTRTRRLRATFEGHTGVVWGVSLSADGRLLASGGQDGTIKLWDVQAGRLLTILEGHADVVQDVSLSADGRLLASGGRDGTVQVWDTQAGRPLTTLQGHVGGVWCVTLSADGRLLASGGYDRTVRVWETEHGQPLATLQGHGGPIQAVALSQDGQLLASGAEDGTATLWETASGQLLATVQGQTGGVWGMAFSADGRLLASGGQDGTVKLWDAAAGQLLTTLRGHASVVRNVTLSADGRLLASGSWDETIKLWDTAVGQLLVTLPGHRGGVPDVALSAHGRLLASGGQDGTVKLWDTTSGKLLATLDGHGGMVRSVALSADGQLLASSSWDGTARLWTTQASGRLLATLEGSAGKVWCVALSRDGRLAAGGGADGVIRLWDTANGRLLTHLDGHATDINHVALSADGQLLASKSWDGTIRLWDTGSGRPLVTLEGHAVITRSVALSANGRLLASGGYDGTITLWEAASGGWLRSLRGDHRYERMDITGLTGVTEAQRTALDALGAVEQARAPVTPLPLAAAPHPSSTVKITASTPRVEPVVARPSPRPPTNVLPARTSFIGHAADLTDLARVLDPVTGAGARLLTLSGMAGCGKTRLALAVAEALRDAYADGVWLVALAPLTASPSTDPTAVAGAVVTALDLREQPGQALLDTLIAYLQTRRLLLVLDNCEHVVVACAALTAQLLGACPELRILTTSQQALGIADETMWPVGALALPPAVDGTPTPETLGLVGQSEAVRLFVERAQAVRPGFALSVGDAPAVATICRRLDGLPLAIELAAARLYVLPVAELLTRLDDRFRLLRRGGHATGDRHQTLQATLDWSYGLLDPAEQALLRRVSVFAGGWEVATAEVVCAGDEVAAEVVLELLDELVERSLVYVYDVEGTPRYGLLETVRQYGAQRLERAGEMVVLRDRRLAWCVALAEQATTALQGGEQAAWLERLEREHDNLREALTWALDRGLSTLGLRLAAGLWMFWLRRGHRREGRRWLAALLALTADDDDAASRAVRASALEGAAWLADDGQDFAQASTLFAQSNALRHALGQDERSTGHLINAAMEARAGGDYARATALLEESLAQHRALGNREGIIVGGLGLSLSRLALVLAEQGAYARATALYEECLALVRERGDREGMALSLLGLGDVARDLGDVARAQAYGEECLALFRELGHPWAIGFALNNLALAAYLDGDLALAARQAEEAVAIFRDMQAGPSLAEALVTLGRVRGARGEGEAARADLAEARALAAPVGPRLVVAAALDALGVLAVGQGQAEHRVHLLAAAARMRQEMGTPVRPADRPAVEGALTAARSALGDASFAQAWAAEKALPEEYLVAQIAAGPGDDTNG